MDLDDLSGERAAACDFQWGKQAGQRKIQSGNNRAEEKE